MKHALIRIFIFLILLVATVSIATTTHWRSITPGIEYAQIDKVSGFHRGYIHAFRVDLSLYKLELAFAQDGNNRIGTVKDLTLQKNGIIGINGGFFSQELRPLGLRISDNKIRNPLKGTPWWGVFFIQGNQPAVVSQKNFHGNNKIQFAIQSGPRLLTQGKVINSLKHGKDDRTALCITPSKKVILVVTQNLPLTTTQLAKALQAPEVDGGLDCKEALNLDGGSSTQLYVKTGQFNLNVPGLSAVTDAILVIPKAKLPVSP